jgi:virginiamycin A acetyltransferase
MEIKTRIKEIADLIFLVLVSPLAAAFFLVGFAGNGDRIFWSISQFLSLFPGFAGDYVRRNFYRLTMTRCDRKCAILFGTLFSHADTEIGKGVYIGPNCNIGKCRIEDHCTLGSNVHIMSGKNQHNLDDLDTPVQDQGGFFEKVTIGENTWIGNCAVVMANVGKKSVIGAGSVVTKDVEPFSIVAGNPARLIRKRTSNC